MRILHVITSVDPAMGGPIEGIKQFTHVHQAHGRDVEVVSIDAPSDPWVHAAPFKVHALGPGHTHWRYTPRLYPWLREHHRAYDAVVVNGIWQYGGYATWRALRGSDTPYFVFTHGMLDPYFKRQFPLKHLKKWLVWPWADYRVLRDARAVLFTCEEERVLASRSFWLYRARETVLGYGINPPQLSEAQAALFRERYPALAGRRALLFLSRVHPKKGLDLLIEACARVAPAHPDLMLAIAGPDHSDWRPRLAARIAELGLTDRVLWTGMLSGDLKWGAFQACEAFVLPSHQENFGIAVVEALACRQPVLISDQVNIWREIDQARAGLVQPDTVDGTERLLRGWLALDPAERAEMRARARECFERWFDVRGAARRLTNLIEYETGHRTLSPSADSIAG
jgi:glycosyltransferase involved in cell wall biosynthesis